MSYLTFYNFVLKPCFLAALLPPQTKLREGNVFIGVCLSTGGREPLVPSGGRGYDVTSCLALCSFWGVFGPYRGVVLGVVVVLLERVHQKAITEGQSEGQYRRSLFQRVDLLEK